MAVHRTVDSFVGALGRLPKTVTDARNDAVRAAALTLTGVVRQRIGAASGGDSRLSGVGRSGARVGAGFNIKGVQNPTALVAARGPVHLIERPTKPHQIPRRATRGRRRRKLVIGGNVVTGPVMHPGTAGKFPWQRGVNDAMPLVRRAIRSAFRAGLKKGFR